MTSTLRQLFAIFGRQDRWVLVALLACMIVSALFEVGSVASIMPFIALLTTDSASSNSAILSFFFATIGTNDLFLARTVAGILTLALLVLGNAFALLTNWIMLRVIHGHAHVVSNALLRTYLNQPHEFFLRTNTAELNKNIITEVNRMTHNVIIPAFQMLAKGIVVCLLLALLIAVEPWLAISAATVLGTLYALVYVAARKRLDRYGLSTIQAEAQRFKAATEALSGVKEIQLTDRRSFFLRRFYDASLQRMRNNIAAEVIKLTPRYVIEVIAFGGIVAVALYLLQSGRSHERALSILALYAFAGYRLMPAIQQIYAGISSLRYHGPVLTIITEGLRLPPSPEPSVGEPLTFHHELRAVDVGYGYPGGSGAALDKVSVTIRANTTVGLVGRSGAGKSTLADMFLGLLPPAAGHIEVDGVTLGPRNLRAWRDQVGYVPQHIYLTDDSIAANIAFGIAPEDVDQGRLERAARLAHLHDFIATLPEGYTTRIGERGVRLSGGQRQRIGLARALYGEPALLVLDEATSALDNVTESLVMEAIKELSGRVTMLIIAHRLTTVQACDVIHMMAHGRIVASGHFDQLMSQSRAFRELAMTQHPAADTLVRETRASDAKVG